MKKIGQLANYGKLTGLGNRRLFFEALELALSRADLLDKSVAVFSIDMDRLKIVNDLHGQETGDHFLKEAARRMIAAVRGRDNVYRVEGGEFTIVAEGTADVGRGDSAGRSSSCALCACPST